MRLVRCLAAVALGAVLVLPAGAFAQTGPVPNSRLRISPPPISQAQISQAQISQAGGTLERVRQDGMLRCGVIANGVGLALLDHAGNWQGFYPDMCRAVAAATVGSAGNVEFVETNAGNRFEMVRNGSIDVSMTSATWTLQRSATQGVDFPVVYLFDGQGVMIHRSSGVRTLADVKGGTACVLENTTSERNLENWVARTGNAVAIRRLRSLEGAYSAFFNRHCDMVTSDRTGLYARRMLNGADAADHPILSDVISKEPLAPMVRSGDQQWFDIVRWVVLAMILAEEKGLSSADAATLKETGDPEVSRLLGQANGLGEAFGLDKDWAARVIAQVGSYGEVFDRNLGKGSPLGIERGLNALWSDGGLHFAPPLGW